jgi:hypothetical protein
MNKVEIIQQIVELRRDLADLQRDALVKFDRYPVHWDEGASRGRELTSEELRIHDLARHNSLGQARARVEGMLRRIAKDEDKAATPNVKVTGSAPTGLQEGDET